MPKLTLAFIMQSFQKTFRYTGSPKLMFPPRALSYDFPILCPCLEIPSSRFLYLSCYQIQKMESSKGLLVPLCPESSSAISWDAQMIRATWYRKLKCTRRRLYRKQSQVTNNAPSLLCPKPRVWQYACLHLSLSLISLRRSLSRS